MKARRAEEEVDEEEGEVEVEAAAETAVVKLFIVASKGASPAIRPPLVLLPLGERTALLRSVPEEN